MNFHQSTVSAILAAIIAAIIIAVFSYLWKRKSKVDSSKKKRQSEQVGIERFIKNVKRLRSKDQNGFSLSIVQTNGNKNSYTTNFDKIIQVKFVRHAAPKKNLLILKFSDSSKMRQRIAFVEETEFDRVCRELYFKEVYKK